MSIQLMNIGVVVMQIIGCLNEFTEKINTFGFRMMCL